MEVVHIEWLLYYWTCLFSVLKLDTRYDWQLLTPNSHNRFFPIIHLCVVTSIAWKVQVIHGRSAYQMIALLLETFLVWLRLAWEIRLDNYGRRHILVALWYIQQCVYKLQACTYIHRSLVLNYTWQQTNVPYDRILHTKWCFYSQQCIVLKQHSWNATLQISVSLQLSVYANVI